MSLYLAMIASALLSSALLDFYRGATYSGLFLLICAAGAAVAWWSSPAEPKPTHRDHNCKESTCCPGELLIPMHSTDTKLCTGCKTEQHWPLEPDQRRTFE